MKKWIILFLLVLSGHAIRAAERPNIVLIFVDDMGYGDPGCYGGTLVPTPAIDLIASRGVLFTDGYVTAPVCAPSRYGLLSGAYPQRFGVQWNNDTFDGASGLIRIIPGGHLTIDETLSKAGYVTGMVGKWNLEHYPCTSFEETYSVIHFGADYFPDSKGHYPGVNETGPKSGFRDFLWGPVRDRDEYLTDRIGRQAASFIGKHQEEPFFLYVAFNAVHSPFMARQVHRDRVNHIDSEILQYYGAMTLSLDENIQQVLDALERHGLRESTMVVFASDNGPATGETLKKQWKEHWPEEWPGEIIGSAGPLAGRKGQFLEGGIRIPFILSWPGKIGEGTVYREPVTTLDLYPTFCEAAGADVPASTRLDGVSLIPYLTAEKSGEPHSILYWMDRDRGAVRKGDWKLLVRGDRHSLYHLGEDIGETADLSDERPDILTEMEALYLEFKEEMPPPIADSE